MKGTRVVYNLYSTLGSCFSKFYSKILRIILNENVKFMLRDDDK